MTGEKPSHTGAPARGRRIEGTDNASRPNGANADSGGGSADRLRIDTPSLADGAALYRITRDSGVLDVNSSYVYVMWCRDFPRTSVVARVDGSVVGFVTGYLRPDAPDTLVVWQVAVDASQRGGGVAARLLRALVDRARERGAQYLETTITADNTASIKLFSALARDRSAELVRRPLFTSDLFPDAHESEDLYRIGPFAAVD